MSLREAARGALAAWGVDEGALVALAGDASSRRYLRGRDPSGRSVVVMDCGSPLPPIADGRDGFAFTRWQARYRTMGIRVPEILGIDRDAGLVLLEDLGDELLQFRVESAGAAPCEPHYRRAIGWGLVLAEEGTRILEREGDPDEDPLVPARLALEMDLLLVHASGLPVPAASAPPLRAAEAALHGVGGAHAEARALLHQLCRDAHALGPMRACHRDYHARNLILLDGDDSTEVAVIDFQDTRRGPRAYDLASLAWDPYVELPEAMIERMVEAWRPRDASATAWDEEVRLAAGQRLLKAAGSYAWLSRACGRSQYAAWFAPAIARAHERLSRWPAREATWKALAAAGVLG